MSYLGLAFVLILMRPVSPYLLMFLDFELQTFLLASIQHLMCIYNAYSRMPNVAQSVSFKEVKSSVFYASKYLEKLLFYVCYIEGKRVPEKKTSIASNYFNCYLKVDIKI